MNGPLFPEISKNEAMTTKNSLYKRKEESMAMDAFLRAQMRKQEEKQERAEQKMAIQGSSARLLDGQAHDLALEDDFWNAERMA